MKKFLSLFIIFGIIIGNVIGVNAVENITRLVSVNEVEQYGFSDNITNMIRDNIRDGKIVYYGEGTTSPDYLNTDLESRSIPSRICNLPESYSIFSFDMTYGNNYFSPYMFKATSSCSMKIHASCTTDFEPCNIQFKVINANTNTEVINVPWYVTEDTPILSIPLASGGKYYFEVTPVDSGESHVSFYVYGQ